MYFLFRQKLIFTCVLLIYIFGWSWDLAYICLFSIWPCDYSYNSSVLCLNDFVYIVSCTIMINLAHHLPAWSSFRLSNFNTVIHLPYSVLQSHSVVCNKTKKVVNYLFNMFSWLLQLERIDESDFRPQNQGICSVSLVPKSLSVCFLLYSNALVY